jgi:hypothetical protein
LLRLGIRELLRLDDRPGSARLETIGDCGAFSYKDAEYPPYSVEEVIEFYAACGFDYGVSVDHVILAFESDGMSGPDDGMPGNRKRQEITLDLADDFLRTHRSNGCRFAPLGVAQGWSPSSYAHSVERLQQMGYSYIAVGGMVPLKTREILESLARINEVRRPETRLHLLGVTRCEHVGAFQRYGVVSFDSTSAFLQSFKDGADNYHTLDGAYTAVRVPQVEGNPKLSRRIKAGQVSQERARRLEQQCLSGLRGYHRDEVGLEEVLCMLRAYEELYDEKGNRSAAYRAILEAQPWKSCPCDICRALGIEVIIFRGSERNKRRGFHNLTVFYQDLHREVRAAHEGSPALAIG